MHPIQRVTRGLLLAAILALPARAVADDRPAFHVAEHRVAMSDGVKLATDVYLPGDGKGSYPVIVARTPYNKAPRAGLGKMVCERGYAFVYQDLRGRFKSEGKPVIIFGNDGWGTHQDGRETLEWIAKQRWCNGKIGSWGGSALGIVQNMAAPVAPEQLKAQFVNVAFSDYYSQAAYQGGAFRKNLLEHWLESQGLVEGNLAAFVAHPRYDDFWKNLNPELQASKVRAPGVFVGGWYDIFVQGTINSFVTIQHHGGEGARGQCRLVLEPVAHGQFKDLVYPYPLRNIPACADVFQWYGYRLKGENNAAAKEKAVHYYVMGDPTDPKAPGNVWRHADDWPPRSQATPFYFHADGTLSRDKPPPVPPPTRGGRAGWGDAREYTYDPKNPVPTFGGQELYGGMGPKDQRSVEKRTDVLVFSTEELREPLEVTGRISARLFVSSDCPDTDFTVKLTDVYPDGRSMLVTDGILRARYRQGFEKEAFLERGQVYELSVDLWSTSIVFNKGHRIRVAVSSSNAPRFEPNPNTGRPFRADQETRIAKNTLHLSARHPSRIVLPVYTAD
jgi:predicted acyl esterase